jgi:hypothetical protein
LPDTTIQFILHFHFARRQFALTNFLVNHPAHHPPPLDPAKINLGDGRQPAVSKHSTTEHSSDTLSRHFQIQTSEPPPFQNLNAHISAANLLSTNYRFHKTTPPSLLYPIPASAPLHLVLTSTPVFHSHTPQQPPPSPSHFHPTPLPKPCPPPSPSPHRLLPTKPAKLPHTPPQNPSSHCLTTVTTCALPPSITTRPTPRLLHQEFPFTDEPRPARPLPLHPAQSSHSPMTMTVSTHTQAVVTARNARARSLARAGGTDVSAPASLNTPSLSLPCARH